MTSTDISPHSPAVDLVAALSSGAVGSVELLNMYLDRIDRYNPELNAVVAVDRQGGLARAMQADHERAHGRSLGALHGLPVTIKDAIMARGMPCTGGAVEYAHWWPRFDAPAVARLRAAGANVFGKTNLPTWSGDSQSANTLFGRTRNPWNLDRSSGGSSGGSAAALAAGLTGAELGGDLGGSIRIPASHCGVFGHKPSQGIVPGTGSLIFPGSETMDRDMEVLGPLARSSADLVMLLEVLTEPRHGGVAGPVPIPGREPATRDIRLASWFLELGHPLSSEVREVFDRAVAAITDAGATVEPESAPPFPLDAAWELSVDLARASIALSRPPANRAGQTDGSDPVERAMSMSHREWIKLDAERRRLRDLWGDFLQRFDAVLCPVSATAATPHDDETTGTRMVEVDGEWIAETAGTAWDVVVSGLHLPATVIPAGLTRSGLPVGVMIVGRYLDDWTTLAVAGRLEGVLGPMPVPAPYGGAVGPGFETS